MAVLNILGEGWNFNVPIKEWEAKIIMHFVVEKIIKKRKKDAVFGEEREKGRMMKNDW